MEPLSGKELEQQAKRTMDEHNTLIRELSASDAHPPQEESDEPLLANRTKLEDFFARAVNINQRLFDLSKEARRQNDRALELTLNVYVTVFGSTVQVLKMLVDAAKRSVNQVCRTRLIELENASKAYSISAKTRDKDLEYYRRMHVAYRGARAAFFRLAGAVVEDLEAEDPKKGATLREELHDIMTTHLDAWDDFDEWSEAHPPSQ